MDEWMMNNHNLEQLLMMMSSVCMYDQWQLEWQMDFSMKIWLKFSWWYTFSFWILDWNGIFLERNFGTTRNKMKWAIWWWWCWRRWILLMMNKWMMNWIFIQWFVNGKNWKAFFNGESFNVCVLQWEKLNGIFQWHFWLIFLVEIHSMCVFSMENHSMGKSMENHSMGIFNGKLAMCVFWMVKIECVCFEWEWINGDLDGNIQLMMNG